MASFFGSNIYSVYHLTLTVGESVKNTLSETLEITIAVSIALNHLNLVVAAFGETVRVRNIK